MRRERLSRLRRLRFPVRCSHLRRRAPVICAHAVRADDALNLVEIVQNTPADAIEGEAPCEQAIFLEVSPINAVGRFDVLFGTEAPLVDWLRSVLPSHTPVITGTV